MDKKFKILRIIGTVWKIMAWIALFVGILSSVGVLLMSLFGGGVLSQFGQEYSQMPGALWAFGLTGGIIGFIVSLIATIINFLLLYAVGELIYLLLAIEENTRQVQWVQAPHTPQAYPAAPPTYPPPPPPVPQSGQ
ncbi:MAG: hypothetical protein SWK90_00055 [Chloroflexota bacterium]|nr:hypothetical protein [Chloroflexota bacterium]